MANQFGGVPVEASTNQFGGIPVDQQPAAVTEPPPQEELGVLDTAIGAANIANRAIAGLGEEAVAGLTGLAFAPSGTGAEAVEAVREAIPDVEIGAQGQQLIADISEKFQAAPEVVKDVFKAFATLGPSLGESAFQAAEGLPPEVRGTAAALAGATPGALEAATTLGGARAAKQAVNVAADITQEATQKGVVAFTNMTPTKKRIARLIESGSTDVETAKFKLLPPSGKLGQSIKSGVPKIQKDVTAVETIKQGFDEGVIAAVKGSSRADKIAFRKMVNIMERGKKNARFAAENRPSDVAGNTLLNKVKVIRNANRTAGKSIDVIAKSLKGQPVDLSDAVNSFAQSLDDLGVRIIDNGKGGFKPDFELSQLSPGDRGPIKEVIRQMNLAGRGQIDGLSAHKMKRIIDNNVTFGKVKTGISGDAERALKGFRVSIDTALDGKFPKYDRANIAYADTINALNALQDSVGRKLDFSGGNADKALGTSLRGILSNNKSRINLLDSVNELESAARKHGAGDKLLIEGKGLGGNDLLSQILVVDELDRVFGPVARTSFQGQVQQGVEAAARGTQGITDLAIKAGAKAADKVLRINEENAFKSIKKLLRE